MSAEGDARRAEVIAAAHEALALVGHMTDEEVAAANAYADRTAPLGHGRPLRTRVWRLKATLAAVKAGQPSHGTVHDYTRSVMELVDAGSRRSRARR